MGKYKTAVRNNVLFWVDEIKTTDILIGIPCYNCEESIGYVIEQVAKGLNTYFSEYKTAIFISDGGSLDDTRENAYAVEIPENVARRVTIYRGLPGKGTSFRAVFELAIMLKAKAIGVFDADLRSITPEWVKFIIEPILDRSAGFVTPYYRRHKFDGTITNQIVYPMTRALYGVDVRQPIGGDFGCCPELAAFYVKEDVWETDVARFGIDVWMTTCAINEGFKVVQTYLGTKIHGAKDPASDLGPMFRQVVSTLFYLMGKYEHNWDRENSFKAIEIKNNVDEEPELEAVSVSMNDLREEFVEGFRNFRPLYDEILNSDNISRLDGIYESWAANGDEEFDTDLWSKILYDFAYTYQQWLRNKRRLVDILTPLYFGRTKSYCQQVMNMDSREAEKVVQDQAAIFEKNKPYLLKRFKLWEK
ncbi:MAG: glycosyl transferase [Thermodesulfobacteriota bacterium]|nr:MAG: glycosyl transferase [Thermodesulfobacteriota bacterium]